MFTYICLGTNDLERSCRFYDAVMGRSACRWRVRRANRRGQAGSLETSRRQDALWLCQPFDKRPVSVGNGTMIVFQAASWQQVDAFFAAAIANGGQSEGEPGLRPQYNADFYAAYVRDPDGNKLAAVCRGSTASRS